MKVDLAKRLASEAVNTQALLMFRDGEWVGAASGQTFGSINPSTGAVWATAPLAADVDVDLAVNAAARALEGSWGAMAPNRRGRLIHRLGELIAEHSTELAQIESTDNGKIIRETAGQMKVIPDWYEYFSGMADKILGTTIPLSKPGMFAYTRREPSGVVGAILPWNSPLLLLAFKLAPALAAGCTFVVKPAEQTPASTLKLAELIAEAGFPPGVFNVVTGDGETGRLLAGHAGVAKVAFTGSTESGRSVMKSAANHLAPVSLELGGKSPNIVFEDADIDSAVNGVIAGIFAATGQTCVAGSRLLVHESICEEFISRIAERARGIRLGDPLDEMTEMGPVAFQEQMDRVLGYVDLGVREGAELFLGGKRVVRDGLSDGYFIEPTIFTKVENSMQIAQEEIFGPVLSVIAFSTEEEAVGLANDSRYGLGAGIWTRDIKRAHRVAQAIRAGTIWLNCYRVIGYDVPFGGYKESGIGRENGMWAVLEYTSEKAIWVDLSESSRDPFVLG